MKKTFFAILLASTTIASLLQLASCRPSNKQIQTAPALTADSTAQPAAFPLPEVPPIIASPEERATYLTLHYWDNFDFADTTLLHRTDITEQGLVDYLNILSGQSEAVTDESLQNLCTLFAPHAPARITLPALFKKYLYEPNSPFFNEPLFARFVHFLTLQPCMRKDPSFSRWEFLQKLMARNNPGQPATDFTCYDPDGKPHSLRTLPRRPVLLYFYDPQCQNCYKTLQAMKACGDLQSAVAQGKLTVLAVDTEGDEEAWCNTLDEMPDNWTVTTDRQSIVNNSLYDLKAMPTLYLLDAERKVVLKDASLADICAYFGFVL